MRKEGILAGGSGGAAVAGALIYAQQTKRKENIVTILPDTGLKYLSRLCGGNSNQATFLRSVEG
jgi:cystathionine beta-synthase